MPVNILGLALASTFALASLPAAATAVAELEPNDTLLGAQFIFNPDPLITISGSRTFADPTDDFFSFNVLAAGTLSIISSSASGGADSVMGLYGPNGMLVASNDDASGTTMSAIQFTIPAGMTGLYAIGFSGYNPGMLACTGGMTACYDTDGDFVFDTFVPGGGAGGSTGFDYAINVTGVALVPEPGSWALIALGLPLLLSWGRFSRSRG